MASNSNGKRASLPSRVEWVKVADLSIGARYQRTLKESKVKAIAENFDPGQFGVPAASRREDGSLHVTDGQHRVSAVRRMGWDDQLIQVEVIGELPYPEEAGMHVDRNANRTSTSAYDVFMGNLEAERPVQVGIMKQLKARDLQLCKSNPSEGQIYAVAALQKIWESGGPATLERVLDIILDAWGPLSDSFAAPVLKGLAKLFAEYDRMVDDQRMARSLKRHRPAEYIKRAHAGREMNRSNVVNNIVVAVVADYNNLPGGRKLPPPSDLVGQGKGGRMRVTTATRAQIVELAKNGYSRREVKERYKEVSMSLIGAIFKEAGIRRAKGPRHRKAS